jgi:ribosomal protein L22
MDGNNNKGFCGSVLGTTDYEAALYALKPILEKSNCHTLDRHDFRAHKDTCGIGLTPAWQDAVN